MDNERKCQLKATMNPLLSVCLWVGILLAGCASPPNVSVEERLGDRSLQWADALMDLDFDKALAFMTPSYQSSPRAERFRADFSGAGHWQDAEIKWVKCDEDTSAEGVSDNAAIPPTNTTLPSDAKAPDEVNDCVLDVWNGCGGSFGDPISTSSTTSASSDRCKVRLTLTVMKPPEMSFPMPIPYELTWLNLDGRWYIYRK